MLCRLARQGKLRRAVEILRLLKNTGAVFLSTVGAEAINVFDFFEKYTLILFKNVSFACGALKTEKFLLSTEEKFAIVGQITRRWARVWFTDFWAILLLKFRGNYEREGR